MSLIKKDNNELLCKATGCNNYIYGTDIEEFTPLCKNHSDILIKWRMDRKNKEIEEFTRIIVLEIISLLSKKRYPELANIDNATVDSLVMAIKDKMITTTTITK